MDQAIVLFLLSLAMFMGCYLAGSIPLALSLSERLLRNVTVFGAGLLIGTAMIVIIPEGIESLYSSALIHDPGVLTVKPSLPGSVDQNVIGIPNPPVDPGAKETGLHLNSMEEDSKKMVEEESLEHLQLYLGLSLVAGFVFMLLIDQLSPSHSHGGGGAGGLELESGVVQRSGGMTATIGLVVHAAADGLALGAAAGLSKTDVEFIIFIAIMLHKAPAAFGFTSFLIHEGFDKRTAKCHLLVFALAAPVAAFISYFGLVRVMYVVQLPITGITMLFSAGTFLYVSTVHVLNEITHSSSSGHGDKLSKSEVAIIVTGALAPLVFNFAHSH